MPTTPSLVHGAPSWRLDNDAVSACLTVLGGHLAPVEFRLPGGPVAPYSLSPWQPDEFPNQPAILRQLRGDFFCLPFGDPGGGGPVHGATANLPWEPVAVEPSRLVVEMADPWLGAQVRKTVSLRSGQWAVFQEHEIRGLAGDFCYGHHPILHFPEDGPACFIRVSPIRFGGVRSRPADHRPDEECSRLAWDGRFDRLDRVPLAAGGETDLGQFPSRPGTEEITMVSAVPGDFAWTAVTFPGYVWLALRDPRDFPSTLFWISHGGRSQAPWLGRHRARIGFEDACSHFADGLESSRRQPLAALGIPTARTFRPDVPVVLRHLQLVQPVPADFGPVAEVIRQPGGLHLEIVAASGARVTAAVDWSFLAPEHP